METLSDVEENVDNLFPWIAELESARIGMKNGAAFAIMYPPSIPEEQGELDDLCSCTLSGENAGGYNEFQYSLGGSLATAVGEISGFSYAGDLRDIASDILAAVGLGGPIRILAKPGRIPYDAIAVRKTMDPQLVWRLRKAFLSLSIHSPEGRAVLEDYNLINGFMPVPAGHYDAVKGWAESEAKRGDR